MTVTSLLEEQLAQVERDLTELDVQVAEGEIDDSTATRLRATYLTERTALLDRIADEGDAARHEAAATPDEEGVVGRTRLTPRSLVGAGLLVAGLVAVAFILAGTITARAPGELATGGVAGDVAAGGGVDLADVSNEEMEQVVAENPEVTGMRLALARRYFEEGDYSSAVPHFMEVLEQDDANAEALSSVGWITHLSGRSDVGLAYLDRSIQVAAGYQPSYWFRANIKVALDDPAGALADLDTLLAFDDLPGEIRTAATELRSDLEAG